MNPPSFPADLMIFITWWADEQHWCLTEKVRWLPESALSNFSPCNHFVYKAVKWSYGWSFCCWLKDVQLFRSHLSSLLHSHVNLCCADNLNLLSEAQSVFPEEVWQTKMHSVSGFYDIYVVVKQSRLLAGTMRHCWTFKCTATHTYICVSGWVQSS